MPHTSLYSTLPLLLSCLAPAARPETVPDPNRGLYAIWTKPDVAARLPFLKGGQVVLQWAVVQPVPDRYDFAELHTQLARIAESGRTTTVQLNANRQPAFLFEKVPYQAKKLGNEQDSRGTLQYWHPAYVKLYTDLIAAFAREVKSSPHRARVMGVRLNYDAIGTEFMVVKPDDRDPAKWTSPAGVALAPPWTEETAAAYRQTIRDTFVRNFSPEIRVFLRTGNPGYQGADPAALKLAATGRYGIFTTASEIEPRMPTMFDGERPLFLGYCRTGTAVCYGESMADAKGKHGPAQDPRWCPPEQYNYWRLLSDLNLGFSMIGIYGADLENATNPEYMAAFEFAARYAGYHASPSVAPGAWVALREGDLRLKGDYTFLMRSLDSAAMKPERKIGPDDQRFGAWARTLAPGAPARFEPHPDFVRSLAGKPATLRVTYLDRGQGAFTVQTTARTLTDSGRWKTAEFPLPTVPSQITIRTTAQLTLHLVEIVRN